MISSVLSPAMVPSTSLHFMESMASPAAEALAEVCHDFDIPCPLWLNKHEREFEDFRHTAFLPEHFMEEVPFQKLEIEFLDDTGVKRRSNDPRNQFDGF